MRILHKLMIWSANFGNRFGRRSSSNLRKLKTEEKQKETQDCSSGQLQTKQIFARPSNSVEFRWIPPNVRPNKEVVWRNWFECSFEEHRPLFYWSLTETKRFNWMCLLSARTAVRLCTKPFRGNTTSHWFCMICMIYHVIRRMIAV